MFVEAHPLRAPVKKRRQSKDIPPAAPAAGGRPSNLRVPAPLFLALLSTFLIAVSWKAATGIPWAALCSDWLAGSWNPFPSAGASLGHLKTILLSVGMTLALIGYGSAALRPICPKSLTGWESLGFSFAFGYGITGSAWLLLGLAGMWNLPFMTALAALGAVRGAVEVRGALAALVPAGTSEPKDRTGQFLVSLVIFAWVYNSRFALVPETFYDALIYHLGLPNQYLNAGRILPTPENSFSGIPSLPEMVNGWSLSLDRWGTTAGLLHSSTSLWVSALFIGSARRMGRPLAGPLAAASFCLCPVVLAEGFRISVGLESALMQVCFFAAAMGVVLEPDPRERFRWSLLSGLFLGFAMATKYPAWLSALALLPLMRFSMNVDAGGEKSITPRECLGIVAVASLVAAPWVLKNYAFYGNPVYPYFHEWVGPAASIMPDWRQIGTPSLDWRTRFLTLQGVWGWLTHPWSFLSPAEEISGSIGPLPLGLLPLIFLVRLSNVERGMVLMCAAFWVPLSVLSELPRFFIPHVAVAAFALAFIWAGITGDREREFARLFPLLAAVCVALAWPLLAAGQRDKLAVFLGQRSRQDSLANSQISYPTPQFAGIDFINSQADSDATVLMVGDARSMYLKRKFIASTPDQPQILARWANAAGDPQDLWRRLRDAGITHILFNPGELSRRRVNLPLSSKGKVNLDSFWKNQTEQVYRIHEPPNRWVEVRAIKGAR